MNKAQSEGSGEEADSRGFLETMTIEDVRAFSPRVAVIPLGSTEPHGPHLPYGTDTCIAEAGAARATELANARGARVMKLPCMPYGNNVNFKAFPMACRIRVETLTAFVCDVVEFLREEGVRKIVFLNAHGGNAPTLQAALRKIFDLHGGEVFACCCSISSFWEETDGRLFQDHSPHAGDYETSIMLHIAGNLVRKEKLRSGKMHKPGIKTLENPGIQWVKPWHLFMPESFGGQPDLASGDKGRQLMEVCVSRMADFLVELDMAPWHPEFPYPPGVGG